MSLRLRKEKMLIPRVTKCQRQDQCFFRDAAEEKRGITQVYFRHFPDGSATGMGSGSIAQFLASPDQWYQEFAPPYPDKSHRLSYDTHLIFLPIW